MPTDRKALCLAAASTRGFSQEELNQDNASVKRVAGLILAAGKSERMGSPKPLLQIRGKSFLEYIVTQARLSDLIKLRIVLGHQADKVLRTLPQLQSEVIINPDYNQGQLSSLIKGLQAIEEFSVEGVMLFLVDHPFVTCELINSLLQQFSRQPLPIVIPTFYKRRGHPMIFGRQLFSELVNAPLDQGAAVVVRSHQPDILHVEVEDQGILIDIDTPEAYHEYVVEPGLANAL
jgi:molybdenum cofactor cytidylyltransferase